MALSTLIDGSLTCGDHVDQINELHRAVRAAGDGTGDDKGTSRSVLLRRTFRAPVEEVWEACSTAGSGWCVPLPYPAGRRSP